MAEILFWFCFSFVVYTYLLYPALVGVLSLTYRPYPEPDSESASDEDVWPDQWPDVDVVIACFNDGSYLTDKIKSIKQQQYPGKIRVILSSDGSTDNTIDWANQQSTELLFIHESQRQGKPAALNRAMQHIQAPIAVFTDARQAVNEMAIQNLILRLQDQNVGAVSGELILVEPESNKVRQMGLYWKYEKFIRKAEARIHSAPGVTGALYAMRSADLTPLPDDCILDDFEMPITRLLHNQRIVFEPGAQAFDFIQLDLEKEKQRKIRTLTGNFQSFSRIHWLFSIRKNPIFWQFISHKVFRLLIPYALIGCVLFNLLLLPQLLYVLILGLQVLFYSLAFLPGFKSNRLVNVIRIFVQLNWSAMIAGYRYYSGSVDVRWRKTE